MVIIVFRSLSDSASHYCSGKICYWVGGFEVVVWEDGGHGRVCHELMANGSKRVLQGRRHDFAITCRADLSESQAYLYHEGGYFLGAWPRSKVKESVCAGGC